MWIYVGVMLFYGLLIMLAYLQVEETLSDPLSRAEGITLTRYDETTDGTNVFNLSWDTKAGIATHFAVGINEGIMDDMDDFGLAGMFEMFNMTEDLAINLSQQWDDNFEWRPTIREISSGGQTVIEYGPPLPIQDNSSGIELVYIGKGNYVHFTNSGSSIAFFVALVPNDWNLTNTTLLGPVLSSDLSQESDFDEYLEDNPMFEALMGDEFISFTSLEGFIALEYFSMWPLMLLIFLAIKTGGTVSKHVDDQSIDILLATGYSRFRFLNEKMMVVLVNLVLVVLAAWIGIILGIMIIGKPVPFTGIACAFLGSMPLALGIIGLSLLLSVLIDENSKTTGAILGLTIFMFMIQIVSNIAGWNDSLGYISLFTYYNIVELMTRHVFDLVNVIVPTAIGMISIIVSYILFWKKEIHA